MRWNDFLFLITDYRDFRPQTCTNGLVFRECKHIKNIFEDVYFTKNSFHITLKQIVLKTELWNCVGIKKLLLTLLSCVNFPLVVHLLLLINDVI
jgi:hypothetical protein